MPLAFPNFDRIEYSVLSHDLSVIDYHLKLRAIDEDVAAQRAELEKCTQAAAFDGPAALKLAREAAAFAQSAPDLRLACKQAFERYRETARRNQPADDMRARLGQLLVRSFAAFSDEDFSAWFEETFASEFEGDLVKAKMSAQGKLGASLDKRKRLIVEAGKNIFRDGKPPAKWRTFVGEDVTEGIIRAFAADWRSRSVRFGVAVTITGYEILKLAEPFRKLWYDAYRNLQLDKLTKRPVFAALQPPAATEAFNGLSAMRG